MTTSAYLLHATEAVVPREGTRPFDLPPLSWQDGDHRAFLVRGSETSTYTGLPHEVRWVKPPDPDPWPVRLAKGVRAASLIVDTSTFLAAVSGTLDAAAGGAVSAALEEAESVSIFAGKAKRGIPYRMGTLVPREAIATCVNFGDPVFDLVDFYDFPRQALGVEREGKPAGQPYPVVRRNLRFGDFDDYREAARDAINTLTGQLVPNHLSLRLPTMRALLHLDGNLMLASERLAGLQNAHPRPGAICPYPAIEVELGEGCK